MIAPLIVEVAMDRPIFFYLSGLKKLGAVDSPGGKYRVYVAVNPRNPGVFDEVFVARPWWVVPKHVGGFSPAVLSGSVGATGLPRVLQGPLKASVIWSANERYIAVGEEGWFHTVYDLEMDSSRHFDPLLEIIVGESDEDTVSRNPRIADQKQFHAEVQRLLDSDGGAVSQR